MILARVLFTAFAASCLAGVATRDAHAQPDRAARVEAIGRVLTEDVVGYVLQPFDPKTRYDADCSAETGKNAEQCHAFVARMKAGANAVIVAEESAVRAMLAPAAADLTTALATLSDDDLNAIEHNVTTTVESSKRPLSSEASELLGRHHDVLWKAASREDDRLNNLFSELFDSVMAELMADPTLQ